MKTFTLKTGTFSRSVNFSAETGKWIEGSRFESSGQNSVRVQIAGTENGFAGYFVGFVPPGFAGRQVHEGPLVPGPWAYIGGNCTVIDNHGGTGRDVEREAAEGRLIQAEAGDRIVMEGVTFEITVDSRRYPHLKLIAE